MSIDHFSAEPARNDEQADRDHGQPDLKSLPGRSGRAEVLLPHSDISECSQAHAIGERFREAVERYDWTLEDERLVAQPVRVDVGVVCLWLGRVEDWALRRAQAGGELIQRADKLMYEAKAERASHIYLLQAELKNGELIPLRHAAVKPRLSGVFCRYHRRG